MAEIRTIAVIGAGTRGPDLAQIFALGGFRTILEDILPASLRRAEDAIRVALDRAIEEGAMTRSAVEAALRRMESDRVSVRSLKTFCRQACGVRKTPFASPWTVQLKRAR